MALPTKQLVTPKGPLYWVNITGEGKLDLQNKPKYTASLYLPVDSPECKLLTDTIDAFWDEYNVKGGARKSSGYKPTKKDPSIMGFSFNTGTTYQTGHPKIITTFSAGDASQGKLPTQIHLGNKRIGNDTIGAISGIMGIYDVNAATRGVSLYLDAVQIVKLVEYNKDPGFGASEEGGYEGEPIEEPTTGFDSSAEAKPRL